MISTPDTITRYSIKPDTIYGEYTEDVRYDLMTVVMICLKAGSENKLIRLLFTLMTNSASQEEKSRIIAEEFGQETARLMKGDIGVMCNLSEYIEQKGIEKGIEKVRL